MLCGKYNLQSEQTLKHPVVPFRSKIHPKRPELAFEKNSKTSSLSTVKMDGISLGRYRRNMNLSSFLLPGLKAERCDPALVPVKKQIIDSTLVLVLGGTVNVLANSKSFKIAQITTSEAKGRQFTEAKVTQRLFSFDTCTYLAIYATD